MSNQTSITYIYALRDPDTNLIRYIGKADNPKIRLRAHMCEKKEPYTRRSRWIASLKERGLRPLVEVLHSIPVFGWKDAERLQIRLARMDGLDLVNGTDGGDGFGSGADNPMFGKKMSPEWVERIRRVHLGKPKSTEHIAKIVESKRGKKYPKFSELNRRRVWSQTSRDKLRASVTGRKHTQAALDKMSDAQRGKKKPEGFGAKISAALKGRPKPPMTMEHRAKLSAAGRRRKWTPETRAKMVNALSGRKRPGAASGFVGVTRHNITGSWAARADILGHTFYLGLYPTELAAAQAYDWVAALYGRPLNFPLEAHAIE